MSCGSSQGAAAEVWFLRTRLGCSRAVTHSPVMAMVCGLFAVALEGLSDSRSDLVGEDEHLRSSIRASVVLFVLDPFKKRG
jgi:hypothetical protein